MAINFEKVPVYIKREIDPPKKTITKGASGMTVKRIQEWLHYHNCRTAMDAKYGPATASCVKDFQQKVNLEVNGNVDLATWRALVKPMTDALKAPSIDDGEPSPMTVAKVAQQHVRQNPHEIGGDNRGPWVRLYCNGNDGRAWAWCAGFVTLIMQQAFFYRNEPAPFVGSVSCDTLAAQGKKKGLFYDESKISSGAVEWSGFQGACLFLRKRTATDWTHTGIATVAEGSGNNLLFHTIEGNTNDEGSREGFEACERKRSLSGTHYDFVAFDKIG